MISYNGLELDKKEIYIRSDKLYLEFSHYATGVYAPVSVFGILIWDEENRCYKRTGKTLRLCESAVAELKTV